VADSVVACGGGIVLRDENRVLLQRLGRVVYLAVSAEEALARIGDTTGRPLLAGDGARLAPKILDARLALYRSVAEITVDTNGLSVDEVLAEVVGILDSPVSTCVRVATSPGYDVMIAHGLLTELGQLLSSAVGAKRYVIVTDTNVAPLYAERVLDLLRQSGFAAESVVIDAGEESKNWGSAGEVVERLAGARLGRDGAVVALGGGVVGDLAGFAAAVYTRGVPIIQVPTTLLAQVDSSIGGKTGVDLSTGKNLAGAFWQPTLVLADTSVLHSLPDDEWVNGLVEAAKTALLSGEAQTAALEADAHRLVARDDAAVLDTVVACARFKAAVVGDDERESGRRECLNFGHTLGHALENVLGYGAISHGSAVAAGMRFAAHLAEASLGASHDLTMRVDALLGSLGADAAGWGDVDAGLLMEAMLSDKKTRGGTLRFVLLRAPGVWEVVPLDTDKVRTELERVLRGE
jgi:3-dehydroquinate synthase